MDLIPAKELCEILEPAYAPCAEFKGACQNIARWSPESGHAPRGFVGGFGNIEDIEFVLLIAEPGDPYADSSFGPDLSPQNLIEQVVEDTYQCFKNSNDMFHRKMRLILNLAFPHLNLDEQLRRVWIVNTYLCSAPQESGRVPAAAVKACSTKYLQAELELLADCPVITLGSKARDRANYLLTVIPNLSDRLFYAHAASPPGCNHKAAQPSWCAAIESAQQYRQRER